MPGYLASSINIYSEGSSIGSGSLVEKDSSVYLVTAAHVLFQTKGNQILDSLKIPQIKIHAYSPENEDGRGSLLRIERIGLRRLMKHPEKDICIIKIGNILSLPPYKIQLMEDVIAEKNNGDIRALSLESTLMLDEILIGEDIRIVGYPSYLDTKNTQGQTIYDFSYPLVQKGIISGLSNGLGNIIVSGAVYYGNSGGAVFSWKKMLYIEGSVVSLRTDLLLIGIVVSFIPFNYVKSSKPQTYYDIDVSNSGYSVVVPIKYVMDIIESVEQESQKLQE